MTNAAVRLRDVHDRMEAACRTAGRSPDQVTLIAVSKVQPVSTIQELYELGVRDFGESRLQEAEPKIASLPKDIVWHFIGSLQSNKAKKIAELFQVVHTLCKDSQLVEIQKSSKQVEGLIEVNIANESQKAGISPQSLDAYRSSVLHYSQVHLRGLMTIGPALDDPEAMRPYFRKLREFGQVAGAQWLSMGMSNDFDVAIQEGSTHIRVGTALFGARS